MRIQGICLAILLFALKASALDAVLSHTLFYSMDKSGKLRPAMEVYWQVNPNTLHYSTVPEYKIQASIRTDILLINENGTIAQDHYVIKTLALSSIGEITQHSIIDLRRYELPAGVVKLKFRLTDLADSTNRFTYTDSFVVANAPAVPFYSSIELIDTMGNATGTANVFTRDGKMRVPACANFYDNRMNTIKYYAELYNTSNIAKTDYPLIMHAAISKSPTEGVYASFEKKDTIRQSRAMQPAAGEFNMASLPSGNYYLRLTVQNKAHLELASQNLFFQRSNKHPQEDSTIKSVSTSDTGIENVTVLNLKKTFIAKYSLGEIRAILKMLLPFSDPMATNTINGFLKKPDEMYMRYYIYNFFAAINKENPGIAWREFAKRIEEVNKRFGTRNTRGYETDRGFMYLRYGAPTDVITVENEQGALPYEIWQYNNLTMLNRKMVTDALFLFYRPSEMMSDFKLLHSTVPGEIQNSGWRTFLYVNSGQSDISGSQAEQYIGNR